MTTKRLTLLLALTGLIYFSCEENNLIQEENAALKVRTTLGPGESTQLNKGRSATIISDMSGLTPQQLVDELIGTGPNAPAISNVTFSGANRAAGTFSDVTNVFGFENGIVLSTGDISFIQGPNVVENAGASNALPGDADLALLIPGYTTHDATVLEFDFECPSIQEISFQFVFASEEYNEWVDTDFNDVFGFYVNGNNVAVIPSTTIPISINSLNCGNPYGTADNYCALYVNNDLASGAIHDTEADGFTVVMNATASVNPGLNHIKLAIADAGDEFWDSHVLIKSESFVCAPPTFDVDIDIKPGSDPNSVPCNNPDFAIPVAILSDADFDATTVDHTTVTFHGASESHIDRRTGLAKRHEEDVDGDGDLDLVFHFRLSDTDLDCGSTEGTLMGETYDGTPISGSDALNMIEN